ncbi:fibrinogen C domain-containing protein 1-like [Anopheles aquasalis]|uniref:fibrinogen C domain-containing protein 1-like n=1 Tax=Anopheles aquasalis TaxID=42839 RepID=UPI00215AF77D|nr:fibrinogen C domain-containing protein 1-like [Anopheles aquasalis]
MYRLVWFFVMSLLALAMQVRSDSNVVLSTTQSSVEVLKHDGQEKQQDTKEQQQQDTQSLVKDDEHVNQTVALLTNIQQEMEQKRTQSEKAIADNRAIQQQTIILLVEMQQNIQNHREEVAKDRVQVSEWQELITRNQIATTNILKEYLQNISINQVTQNQAIDVLNNLQPETQLQNKNETNLHTEPQQAVVEKQNVTLSGSLPRILSDLKSEMSKQRELITENRNVFESRIEQLKRDNEKLRSALLEVQLSSYRSCKDVPMKVSGKYNIRGSDKFSSFVAYCEQQTFGGGWMVIQHRFDGSLSFDRNWSAYRSGFGDVDGEHWLGLERIHQFTREHDCELLVELKDFYNNSKHARYSLFRIASESLQYGILSLGDYSGTAGDSLSSHIRILFSTPDRDHDYDNENHCAEYYYGGWWFYNCFHAYLNGEYQNASGNSVSRIAWDDFDTDQRSLSYSRMMIRPIN